MSGPLGSSQWVYSSGSAVFYEHQIEQSLRFDADNSGTSSRLYRTYGTVSDQTKFTFSMWVRRSKTYYNGANQVWNMLMSTGTGVEGGGAAFGFESGGGTSGGLANRDRIAWYGHRGSTGGSATGDDRIAGFYRDTTGWYNIVIRNDTSQTSGNRIKYYVNGEGPLTRTTENNPAGNFDRFHYATNVLNIGGGSTGNYGFDGLMAEVVYNDGQSYGPENYGETKNGVWIPKDPSGLTFGNQGFYLKFQDTSNFGDDSSGNNNDFTVANIGTDHQVIESPTIGTGS